MLIKGYNVISIVVIGNVVVIVVRIMNLIDVDNVVDDDDDYLYITYIFVISIQPFL